VHGRPLDTSRIPAYRFVTYLQDHDQVGNRATGDRISASVSDGILRVGAALLLTGPFTPMLFMGEEWGASTPWMYFTDHEDPQLADAVRQGRRREFAEHGWAEEDVPDPQSPDTVRASVLRWDERAQERHASLLAWYRALIALRRAYADLADPRLDRVGVTYDADARWIVVARGSLRVVANLAGHAQDVPVDTALGEALLASGDATVKGDAVALAPESVAILASATR
jgi:maltooligosyltrehalose trehalohydrolase